MSPSTLSNSPNSPSSATNQTQQGPIFQQYASQFWAFTKLKCISTIQSIKKFFHNNSDVDSTSVPMSHLNQSRLPPPTSSEQVEKDQRDHDFFIQKLTYLSVKKLLGFLKLKYFLTLLRVVGLWLPPGSSIWEKYGWAITVRLVAFTISISVWENSLTSPVTVISGNPADWLNAIESVMWPFCVAISHTILWYILTKKSDVLLSVMRCALHPGYDVVLYTLPPSTEEFQFNVSHLPPHLKFTEFEENKEEGESETQDQENRSLSNESEFHVSSIDISPSPSSSSKSASKSSSVAEIPSDRFVQENTSQINHASTSSTNITSLDPRLHLSPTPPPVKNSASSSSLLFAPIQNDASASTPIQQQYSDISELSAIGAASKSSALATRNHFHQVKRPSVLQLLYFQPQWAIPQSSNFLLANSFACRIPHVLILACAQQTNQYFIDRNGIQPEITSTDAFWHGVFGAFGADSVKPSSPEKPDEAQLSAIENRASFDFALKQHPYLDSNDTEDRLSFLRVNLIRAVLLIFIIYLLASIMDVANTLSRYPKPTILSEWPDIAWTFMLLVIGFCYYFFIIAIYSVHFVFGICLISIQLTLQNDYLSSNSHRTVYDPLVPRVPMAEIEARYLAHDQFLRSLNDKTFYNWIILPLVFVHFVDFIGVIALIVASLLPGATSVDNPDTWVGVAMATAFDIIGLSFALGPLIIYNTVSSRWENLTNQSQLRTYIHGSTTTVGSYSDHGQFSRYYKNFGSKTPNRSFRGVSGFSQTLLRRRQSQDVKGTSIGGSTGFRGNNQKVHPHHNNMWLYVRNSPPTWDLSGISITSSIIFRVLWISIAVFVALGRQTSLITSNNSA